MNSKLKTNYHTHSTFCDGKNTAEEMLKAAIEKKFDILGFSSHSMYPFGETWHIAPRDHKPYVKEIARLKKEYKNKIEILTGFEADFIPSLCMPSHDRFADFSPDYLIGSVHYIRNEKGFVTVDESADGVKNGIEKLFNGNGKKFTQEYYYLEREMLKNGDFEILGHCDLIKLRNQQLHFFNEEDSWYKSEIKALVKEIKKRDVIVEINTGAIARKIMDDIYPSKYILELLHDANIPITINSDSHTTSTLDAAFSFAEQKARDAGFTETAVIKKGRIEMQPL